PSRAETRATRLVHRRHVFAAEDTAAFVSVTRYNLIFQQPSGNAAENRIATFWIIARKAQGFRPGWVCPQELHLEEGAAGPGKGAGSRAALEPAALRIDETGRIWSAVIWPSRRCCWADWRRPLSPTPALSRLATAATTTGASPGRCCLV